MVRYDGWHRERHHYDFGWRNQPGAPPPRRPYPARGHERVGRGWEAERGYPLDDKMMDDLIRSAVRQNFVEDTWLDARDIDIQVENGVVTLTGEVRGHLEARYAWDDAWETDGVRGVFSRIEVRERPGALSEAGGE